MQILASSKEDQRGCYEGNENLTAVGSCWQEYKSSTEGNNPCHKDQVRVKRLLGDLATVEENVVVMASNLDMVLNSEHTLDCIPLVVSHNLGLVGNHGAAFVSSNLSCALSAERNVGVGKIHLIELLLLLSVELGKCFSLSHLFL